MAKLIGMHAFQGGASPPTGTMQIFWPPEYGGMTSALITVYPAPEPRGRPLQRQRSPRGLVR